MSELTNFRYEILNGKKLSMFDITRDGQRVAMVSSWNTPFAKFSVHSDSGRVQFNTKDEALIYCTML